MVADSDIRDAGDMEEHNESRIPNVEGAEPTSPTTDAADAAPEPELQPEAESTTEPTPEPDEASAAPGDEVVTDQSPVHTHAVPRSGRWTRPHEGRILGGVAAGIAVRTDLPLWFVRTAFVITAFAGGFGLAAYLAAWALMPEEGADEAVADDWRRRLERADTPSKKLGVGLIGLGVLIAIGNTGLLSSPLALAGIMVVVGVALIKPSVSHQ
jgi:phage shock protein PspC (stress-responsive transcriptional regulator)